MLTLASWVGLPLAFLLLSFGLGLLADRIARFELPVALLAPVGACVAIVLVLPVYRLADPLVPAVALLCGAAALGLGLALRGLRGRLRPGWVGLAGLLALALYMAPMVLSGTWTWLGYNFVNDTANNMLFAAHVAEHGLAPPQGPPSTSADMVNAAVGTSYPMGAFTLLATLAGLLGVGVEVVYQPVIAVLAAFAALSLAVLARSAGVRGPWLSAVGALSAGAALTYSYAMHGAVKEVALVLVVATAAALLRHGFDRGWTLGAFGLAGVVLAAGVAVISAAAAGYAGFLAAAALAAFALERRRPPWRRVAAGAGVALAAFAVAAAPALADALSFLTGTATAFRGEGGVHGANSTVIFGHLVRDLPPYQALGVWLGDDYRYPIEGPRWTLTLAAMAIAGALAAVTAAVELRSRRLAVLLLAAPALATYLLAAPRLTAYADAKLLLILSPALVLAAGVGAWHLGRRARWLGVAAGAVLAGGVLLSDALTYHSVRVAPVERMQALADAAAHAEGAGPWLHNEWAEFAKYYERDLQNNLSSEAGSPAPVVLRRDEPIFAKSFDLDAQALDYVQSFPGLILRRSPAASRPPANYVRTYANEYYELWRRQEDPRVFEHLPLQRTDDATAQPACRDIRALAARAQRRGHVLLAAARPEPAVLEVPEAWQRPAGWNPSFVPGTVAPAMPGRAQRDVELDGGRYQAWVRGSTGRPLEVAVDGETVGHAEGVNTPGQWLRAGSVRLEPGVHELSLTRPGGGLAPGDGFAGEIGDVVLVPEQPVRLVEVDPARAEQRLCGRQWDWIERVDAPPRRRASHPPVS